MPRGSKPSASAIRSSAMRGLGIRGNLSPALVATVAFRPTLGITAARIDKLSVDIRSFREPLKRAIQRVMIPSIRTNFASQGRPPWEPLSDVTVSIRERDGYSGGPILNRTGRLEQVVTQLNIWDITRTSAVIRDLPQSVWYGKVQQGGYGGNSMGALVKKHKGNIRKANAEHSANLMKALQTGTRLGGSAAAIPAREFLVIQPEDVERVQEVFIQWLGERVARAWP